MKGLLRSGWRLSRFIATCLRAGMDRPAGNCRARADWNQRTGRRIADALGLEVQVEGDPGGALVWVGNHLGYLDVVGLSTVRPVAFVSKAEVARWPLIGGLARRGGSLFLERSRRMGVGEVTEAMRERVGEGVPVVFFPEGTSSAGETVLPFHASLFGPVVEAGWRVAPFAVAFERLGRRPVDCAYWGDMTFGAHFLRFSGHEGVRMHILFGPAERLEGDRKGQARAWRERVLGLQERLRRRLAGRIPTLPPGLVGRDSPSSRAEGSRPECQAGPRPG